MTTTYCPTSHEILASLTLFSKDFGHAQGKNYHDFDVMLSTRNKRENRYRVMVVEHWGTTLGHDQEAGRRTVIGHGDSLRAAINDAKALAVEANISLEHLTQALSKAEDEVIEATSK